MADFVADRLDLKRDIRFDTRIAVAHFREDAGRWDVVTDTGERIVPEGLRTADGQVHPADVIILAVGFDASSGALSRIDIRGRGGRSLRNQWKQEIRTAMGLHVHGYPNLFITGAPLALSAALCNMTTCLQQQVDWITECIAYARRHGKQVVEATKDFEERWVRHHDETAAATLVVKTDSWYMGSNVDGKPRRLLSYIGGVGHYHRQCDELAADGKCKKAALTACSHKLLRILNTMARSGKAWNPELHGCTA